MDSKELLRWILRLMGCSSLSALIFVAAPFEWMSSAHQSLGMGPLPDQPVVGYLARSTSAFYAMLGGLFWVISFDLRRHRRVLVYLSAAVTSLGGVLLVVDWTAGLPLWWVIWEGPFVIAFGLTLSLLVRRIE